MGTAFQYRRNSLLLLLISLSVLGGLIVLCTSLGSFLRARSLRGEICELELGKSTFADAERIYKRFGEYTLKGPIGPSECSPQSCGFVMSVRNPLPGIFHLWPRMGLVALVEVSNDIVKARYIAITQIQTNQALEVFVEQSTDTSFQGDVRVLRQGPVPRVGLQVSATASARFVDLTKNLELGCLARIGGCSEPLRILPYLKQVDVASGGR
jgi:hypothetical protein